MKGVSTTKASSRQRTARAALDYKARTPEQRHAAAMADPDARPIRPQDMSRMRRTPQVKVIRQAFKLSQEEFAERYHIPIGTLRDWEQRRKEPDAAAKAYLRVIAREPEIVRRALEAIPVSEPAPEPAK